MSTNQPWWQVRPSELAWRYGCDANKLRDTSDRQRLMEDDERVVQLQSFLRNAFVKASEQWSKERPERKAKDALASYPKLKEWLEARPPWQKPSATAMIGTIASIELEKPEGEEKRQALFRAGVLAFERLGLRETAEDLNHLSQLTATELLPLLGRQDAYEAGLWADILRSRVEAIQQFQNLSHENEKEKVLQKHLFQHLWLLDAAWERATESPTMEEDLRRIAPGIFAAGAEGNQLEGRIDIRYRTVGGAHVIVELKRYAVKKDATELADQGTKYYEALQSILEQQNRPNEKIEVIFVLGSAPGARGRASLPAHEFIAGRFRPFGGRYVLYDELIGNAKRQYEDYLKASYKVRELDELLESLSTGATESQPAD